MFLPFPVQDLHAWLFETLSEMGASLCREFVANPTPSGNLSAASIEEIDCTPSNVIDLCDSDDETQEVTPGDVESPLKHKLVEFLVAVLPYLFRHVPDDVRLTDASKFAALRVSTEFLVSVCAELLVDVMCVVLRTRRPRRHWCQQLELLMCMPLVWMCYRSNGRAGCPRW
jgi:hypothetical protein